MNSEDKALAIEILSSSNRTKISFNVPIEDSFSNISEIIIHECNAATIGKLIAHGFSLFMGSKGLVIDKFGRTIV